MKKTAVIVSTVTAVLLMTLASMARAQTETLTKLWNLDPGSRSYLPAPTGDPPKGDDKQRGVAYNPVSKNVLLVSRTGATGVYKIDSATGADRGTLDVTGILGGTFDLSQIAVAVDGAIYAANLVTSNNTGTGAFKIYRWASESATPTVAYSGELVNNTRWGDNMEIRGSGNNTQILFGQGSATIGNRLAIFTTANGSTFTPTVMPVSGLNDGETRGGVAFGRGDTFFTKDGGGTSLRHGAFDLAAGTATVTATGTLPTGLMGFSPLGSWPEKNLLGAIQYSGATVQTDPHKVYLFDVSDPSSPITLDFEPFVNPPVTNQNGAGAVDSGDSMLFALDTNNGLYAFAIAPEPSELAGLIGLALAALCRRRFRRK